MINVGFIGAGLVAPLHLEGLRRLGEVQVVAVALSDQERADRRAAELRVPRAYAGYHRLLDDSAVDVVHIMLPNALQPAAIKAALSAGKHVLAEKPLALSGETASELDHLARASSRLCAVNFHYRYYASLLQARRMVSAGELGEVLFIQGGYLQDWRMSATISGWRWDPALNGASYALSDIGSHFFDLISWLVGGRLARVMARRRDFGSHTADGLTAVMFETVQGVLGCAAISQYSPGRKNRLSVEIGGSLASVAWNLEDPNRLWTGHLGQLNQEALRTADNKEFWAGGMRTMLANFYRDVQAARDGSELHQEYPTFTDGLQACQIVEAALHSLETGGWVVLAPEGH